MESMELKSFTNPLLNLNDLRGLIVKIALFLLLAAPLQALPEIPLTIGKHKLTVEVAATPADMQRGLMFRDTMPSDHGMIFIFPAPREASFWMRNTTLPLSVAYLDAKGTILEIHDLEPFNETPVRSKTDNILYAIETNRDWFSSRDIGPGTKVEGIPSTNR